MTSALIRTLVVALLWVSPSIAQQPALEGTAAEAKAAARAHFQEAVALAQQGDLQRAVRAFEAAYAASPHHSVLYNLAQTQAALGSFVAAVTTLERYLSEGGSEIAAARRETATGLLAQYRKSVGSLKLLGVNAKRTRVWLDGVELQEDQTRSAISVDAGTHLLIHVTDQAEPVARELNVPGGTGTEVEIEMPSKSAGATLGIACDIGNVSVQLDEQPPVLTPVTRPMAVASGRHRLRFSLAGRRSVERTLELAPGNFTTIYCGIGAPPPPGPGPTESADKAKRDEAARSRRRLWGVGLGGGGVAMLLAGGSLALWNQGRFDDLQAATGRNNPDPNRVIGIQRVDDLSIGLALAGTGLIIGGLWTFFSQPEH